MFIDSHAHLFYDDYKNDINDIIQKAVDNNIEKIIIPATNLETSHQAIELAGKFSCCYACVGFHPLDVNNYSTQALQEIKKISTHSKVVAIGEIGLDYFYDTTPREKQILTYREQIELAIFRNLPIVVHTRDSIFDAVNIVEEYCEKNPQWKPHHHGLRGVFHCFSGNAETAQKLFQLGFLVSYPGVITFKKNIELVETLQKIGCENIMVETDSPFLTPVPHRGKRNEPSYIPLIAEKIAEVCNISVKQVAEKTTANAKNLFGLQ